MNILLITIALYIGQSLVLKYSFISCLFYYSITRFYIFIGLFLQYLRFCAVPFIFISFFSLDSAYSQTNSDGKIFIEAEKVFYDHGKDTVLASGNVHVIKDNNMIMGDYLLYDRINNIIKMNGNIASG